VEELAVEAMVVVAWYGYLTAKYRRSQLEGDFPTGVGAEPVAIRERLGGTKQGQEG
jgi:hypothetical protein